MLREKKRQIPPFSFIIKVLKDDYEKGGIFMKIKGIVTGAAAAGADVYKRQV